MLTRASLFTTLFFATLAAAADPPIRVLFIGNSLTYTNGLPAMVEAFGRVNGTRLETRAIAFPDFSLEDHWKDGAARRAIAAGKWSFVVLQQGPSSRPESRKLLVEYARRFSAEAARVGAKTALFMVWPPGGGPLDFERVVLSYETAAREAGVILLPAGHAWKLAYLQDPGLNFYSRDGFHPTPFGSYLAALVIFQGLTGKPPVRLPDPKPSDRDASILQIAASQSFEPPARPLP